MLHRSVLPAAAALALAAGHLGAQWAMGSSGTRVSLRGLHVVDDRVIWASGQRGTVLRSSDGGETWQQVSIPGADSFDIRAIHARDGQVAHAAATAGRIWRTLDGGGSWSLTYRATDTSVFLDAITFFDDRRGLALGDPIGGRFLLLVTEDGGEHWREAPADRQPAALEGEAAFAASGTSLVTSGASGAWLGTGGAAARVLRTGDGGRSWVAAETPLIDGKPSTGVFSLAFSEGIHGIAVGGDYQQANSAGGNAAYSVDGGRSWHPAGVPPRGYRSGVSVHRTAVGFIAIAVGTSGADYSDDGGRTWHWIDSTGFNAVQISPGGTAFAVGGGGRVARLDLSRMAARRREE